MKKLSFLSFNTQAGLAALIPAFVLRLARWYEHRGVFNMAWLTVSRDAIANFEHLLTAFAVPALFAAAWWFSWGQIRPRLQGKPWLGNVEAVLPPLFVVASGLLYVVHSYLWEHQSVPLHAFEATHPLGMLANQFGFDCAGVTAYVLTVVLLFGLRSGMTTFRPVR